jgi:protoheme IX farnesyltransferase
MLKEYYRLAKPGIVYGNLLTTVAAYLYASRWGLVSMGGWESFLATIFGLGLIIASACVFNNYLDSDIDRKMERTKDRALVSGAIPQRNALLYGTTLGVLGFVLLLLFVNAVATTFALFGFIVYVVAYTSAKRLTPWATEIGSIAGAVPIVVGYTAVTNQFDLTALILFLILVIWQMPHFYSIAMFRADEYAAAGIPILPLKKGTRTTKIRMLGYIVVFGIVVSALTFFGYAGYLYLIVVELAVLVWLWQSMKGFSDDEGWARKLFFTSLVVLLIFCVMLSLALVLS